MALFALLALASVAAALFYFQCSARRLEAITQAAKTSFKGSEVSVESPPLGLSHLEWRTVGVVAVRSWPTSEGWELSRPSTTAFRSSSCARGIPIHQAAPPTWSRYRKASTARRPWVWKGPP